MACHTTRSSVESRKCFSLADSFQNPGGGTSTVKSLVSSPEQQNLYYIRGHSTMQVSLRDLYDAFMAFRGRTCETNDLKRFRPERGAMCAYAQHPRYTEITRYCLWKQNPSAQ